MDDPFEDLRTTGEQGENADEKARSPQDDEELNELSRLHRDYLRKVIRARLDDRLSPRVDASDLIQETLIEALRRVRNSTAESPLPMRLWLRQLAIDRIKMAQRKHLRTQKRGILQEVALTDHSSIMLAEQLLGKQGYEALPHQSLEQKEVAQAVRKAMSQLPDMDREILSLRTFEDLSYKEIETLTDIPAATARKRYGRALLRLHDLLKAAL